MARAEGMRQQGAKRECGDDAGSAGRVDRRLVGGEFAETLAAGATGGRGGNGVGDDERLDDFRFAAGDAGADGDRLRTEAFRIGRVLDIAARIDPAGRAAHGRAHRKARIGRVRMGARGPRGGEQVGGPEIVRRVHGARQLDVLRVASCISVTAQDADE